MYSPRCGISSQEVDTDLEQQTLHQVVKKSLESLWKLVCNFANLTTVCVNHIVVLQIKESAAYKDVQLELKKVMCFNCTVPPKCSVTHAHSVQLDCEKILIVNHDNRDRPCILPKL